MAEEVHYTATLQEAHCFAMLEKDPFSSMLQEVHISAPVFVQTIMALLHSALHGIIPKILKKKHFYRLTHNLLG